MEADETNNQQLILKWYDDYSEAIFKYIFPMIKDFQQAEDLTQDTYIKVHRQLALGKAINYPKTYLYRVAHSTTIDFIRKHAPIKCVKDIVFNQYEARDQSVESKLLSNEKYQEIYKEILGLKRSYRQVILLRKMEGFSIKETAAILNWSESKVKSTLFRATKLLRQKLEEGGFMYEV